MNPVPPLEPLVGAQDAEPENPAASVLTPPPALRPPVSPAAPTPRPAVDPSTLREFGDTAATRKNIYDNVYDAATKLQPFADDKHTLRLANVRYTDPERFSRKARKQAILTGETVGRRLKGTWELLDNATGSVIDSRDQVIARVPYYDSMGTMTHRGNAYTVNNQQRLMAGVFAREKENGELESHANFLPGKGVTHRYLLDPSKGGVFKIKMQQAELPLMPILKAMGLNDRDLREAWGPEVYYANSKVADSGAIKKLKDKILSWKDRQDPDASNWNAKITEAFDKMELDPEISQRTLGQPFARMDKDAILAATRKLLAVSRGEAESDDRDHPAYQRFVGPEDLIRERVERDHGRHQKNAFWQVSRDGNLKRMPSGLMTQQIEQVLTGSGLAQVIEEINPLEVFDKQGRITRMGEGGLASMDSVPESARAVQPAHFGYLDPIRTPESFKAGIDLNMSRGSRKGKDGTVYTQFHNPRTGQLEWKSPKELADAVVAFPGWEKRTTKRVPVMTKGQMGYAKKEDIDYALPDMDSTFSPLANLVPMLGAVKGQRVAMGSRMLTQALPLVRPEAPLVQTAIPGSNRAKSYEDDYGKHAGAVRADKGGRVEGYADGVLKLRYDDGTKDEVELYQNFPFSRKTFYHQTPMLEPGQTFTPGQLLAKSNYTDDSGATAVGTNARVAYMPWKGLNYEDAFAISESMAKKFTSTHMYQHDLEVTPKHKVGKNQYLGMYAAKYPREVLDRIGDDGVIKPGERVEYGDPLVLATKERDRPQTKLHKKRQPGFDDASVTWKHHDPGIVTDVAWGKNGPVVVVKSDAQMQVGDKMSGRMGDKGVISAIIPDDQMPHDADGRPYEVLANNLGIISRCYDEQTEFLTERGWVFGRDVLFEDKLVCYQVWTQKLYVLQQLERFHVADYCGKMLQFRNKLMDFCVTPNHRMWAACGYAGAPWQEVAADRIAGRKGWIVPIAGEPVPGTDCDFSLPHFDYLEKDMRSDRGDITIAAADWAAFLGWYVAEGNTDEKVHISQSDTTNPENCKRIAALLDRLPFAWHYNAKNIQFHITSKRLCAYLKQFGLCDKKFIPNWVFEQSYATRQLFLDTYLAGDGSKDTTERARDYAGAGTMSRQLADDLQRLLLYQGVGSNVAYQPAAKMWRAAIYLKRHRILERKNWEEIDYDGKIYCPTVPTGYVVTRRNGKVLIAGNTNPNQLLEGWLGKVAAKMGQPYRMENFGDVSDLTEHVINEMNAHGLKGTEDLVDPETQRKIRSVPTGNRFFLKLHHSAESKSQSRGSGGYSMDETPSKGGESGCFTADTCVQLSGPLGGSGGVPLGFIVQERYSGMVSSKDLKTGFDGDQRITDWFAYRVPPEELITITLANGAKIEVTRNHEFILADGTKIAVDDLKPGDDLME